MLHIIGADLCQPYYVNHTPDILTAEQYSELSKTLSEGVPLQVTVGEKNYKNATQNKCNYIKIRALYRADGQPLIPAEAVIQSKRLDSRPVWIGMSAILLLMLCFEAFFCHIVRRAGKYPRLYRLLVKENWRTV